MPLTSLSTDKERSQLQDTLTAGIVMGFPGISAAFGNKFGLLAQAALQHFDSRQVAANNPRRAK